MPLFDGSISLRHEGNSASTLTNHTRRNITWNFLSPTGREQAIIIYPGQAG